MIISTLSMVLPPLIFSEKLLLSDVVFNLFNKEL
jgi:hypothetical protein